VVENVGVTFTPRSVVDDRWQEGFSSLVHTSFAIPGPFFFWKEVKTNPFHPGRRTPKRKKGHYYFTYLIGEGRRSWHCGAIRV
jgi:hypothetical protein